MDTEALSRLFRRPGCARFVARLQDKLARGESLSGWVTLDSPSDEEHTAIAFLIGKKPGRGKSIRIPLDALNAQFRDSGLAPGLREALEAVFGSVVDRRAERHAEEAAWAELWGKVESQAQGEVRLLAWINDLRESGLLVRVSERDPMSAMALMEKAMIAAGRLPASGVRLASLAAGIGGDSHELDSGQPLATLVLRLHRHMGIATLESTDDAELSRRAKWAALGVACHELSGPVLVLGLRPIRSHGYLSDLLLRSAEAGEPCLLPLRFLLKEKIGPLEGSKAIFVCENPTIVSLAADLLGHSAPPMVCTQGMPNAATQALLRQLAAQAAVLRYHGDFDWPGIRIARWLMDNLGALPWRFGSSDYDASPKGKLLAGTPVETSWDPLLRGRMSSCGRAVHEEAIAQTLLNDLKESVDIVPGER